jgi:hypothetical protein
MAPRLAAHYNAISMHAALFDRIDAAAPEESSWLLPLKANGALHTLAGSEIAPRACPSPPRADPRSRASDPRSSLPEVRPVDLGSSSYAPSRMPSLPGSMTG